MSRRTSTIAFSLAQLVVLTFFVAVAGPAHAADKDCSDFATQKAAQLFYLDAGGPQQDPHYLDSDDDGEACESNPCPCYFGTQPPADNPPATPPAPVRSTLTLDASRTSGITGEKVRLVARVKPGFSRPIVLQRKAGDRWVKEVAGKTYNDGRWVLKGSVARRTSTYRAVVAAVKRDGKKYTAATSNRVTVKALDQSVTVTLSDSSVLVGERVVATVTAKPVRSGRRVILQKRTGQGWSKVGTERVNRRGKARFVLDTSSPRTDRYRAVATRYRGAVPFHSAARTLDVAAPPDTTAPGVPAGLTATAGDGYVDLDWSDVADPDSDLNGYHVYYATSAGGPWTRYPELVGTSAYSATGLTNGTTYYFCVRSVDTTGNQSACSATASATPTAPDITAPETPQDLTATPGDGLADLDWTDVTAADLAGYRVYVSTSADGPWTLLTPELVTLSAYRAEGLANDTEHFFHVTAVDAAGNESAPSEAVSTTPAPEPAPEPEPAPAG